MNQIGNISATLSKSQDPGQTDVPGKEALAHLERIVTEVFPGEIALVSSFGAASVVLLHMVSKIDVELPVIFVNTGKLFEETLVYRDRVFTEFGLRNLIEVRADEDALKNADSKELLWQREPDACCRIRKVKPLEKALEGYAAWITGRKRYQNGSRGQLAVFEKDGEKTKVNPLAFWSAHDVTDYVARHQLPLHPLIAKGYPSIGCAPCTSPVKAGEDERAGRWRGHEKTECGIHFTTNGIEKDATASPDESRRIKTWA